MDKRQVKVKLNKNNHSLQNDTLTLFTIFQNIEIPTDSWKYLDKEANIVLIDEKCFYENNLNPCQITKGYIETITVDTKDEEQELE